LRHLEPFVPEFSSEPTPAFQHIPDLAGQVRVALAPGPIGATGKATYVSGQVFRNIGRRYGSAERRTVRQTSHVSWPIRVIYRDLLVRGDVWGPLNSSARVYSALGGLVLDHEQRREEDVLPMRVDVESLGAGLSGLKTPDMPRYAEMLQWAFRRVGWRAEQFHAYRIRVMYPVLPSTIVWSLELPLQHADSE
jgi:hypothetical protein